jgi:hypothetical protein
MTGAADPLVLLSRALDQAEAVVAGIRDDQLSLSTPCRSWDVRMLVDDTRQFTARATGGSPDWSGPRPAIALQPAFRGDEQDGKAFGPQVQVPADAPVYDRLAAFFGREPG